jgi:hypothetical protein
MAIPRCGRDFCVPCGVAGRAMNDATHGLPTPRTTLRARYVSLLVWCKGGCQHQAEADLQALIDAGRGDVPLTRLKFRCSNAAAIEPTPW